MRSFYECIPCVIRQTREILQRNVKNQKKQKQILRAVIRKLNSVDLKTVNPPELTKLAHSLIHRLTGIDDFYIAVKKQSNREALALYPSLKKVVSRSLDPLAMAIRIAIAGNIIDYGALAEFDVKKTIKEALTQDFAVFDYKQFKQDLKNGSLLLYIGDNAGEIVFDKLLIEKLGKQITVVFAVKSKPVLNDVLMADAKMVGLDKVCRVIKSGSDFAGTDPKKTTKEFKKLFQKADIIIAKGQGNFETLDQEKKNIYFLLKMKCPCLAIATGYKKGDIVLKRSSLY
ncbi:MAG: ARMT1-like domain-containing protein [bacterium]